MSVYLVQQIYVTLLPDVVNYDEPEDEPGELIMMQMVMIVTHLQTAVT